MKNFWKQILNYKRLGNFYFIFETCVGIGGALLSLFLCLEFAHFGNQFFLNDPYIFYKKPAYIFLVYCSVISSVISLLMLFKRSKLKADSLNNKSYDQKQGFYRNSADSLAFVLAVIFSIYLAQQVYVESMTMSTNWGIIKPIWDETVSEFIWQKKLEGDTDLLYKIKPFCNMVQQMNTKEFFWDYYDPLFSSQKVSPITKAVFREIVKEEINIFWNNLPSDIEDVKIANLDGIHCWYEFCPKVLSR